MKQRNHISQSSKEEKLIDAKNKYYDAETDEINHLGLLSFLPTVLLNINTHEDFIPDNYLRMTNILLLGCLSLAGYSHWQIRKKMQVFAKEINDIDAIKLDHRTNETTILKNLEILINKRSDLLYELKSLNRTWLDKLVTSAFSLLTIGSYVSVDSQEDFNRKVLIATLSTFFAGGTGITSFIILKNHRKKIDIWNKLIELEDRFEELNHQLRSVKRKDLPGGRKTPKTVKEKKDSIPATLEQSDSKNSSQENQSFSSEKSSSTQNSDLIQTSSSSSRKTIEKEKEKEKATPSNGTAALISPSKIALSGDAQDQSENILTPPLPISLNQEKQEDKTTISTPSSTTPTNNGDISLSLEPKNSQNFLLENTGWNRSKRKENIARKKNKIKSNNTNNNDNFTLQGLFFFNEPPTSTHSTQTQPRKDQKISLPNKIDQKIKNKNKPNTKKNHHDPLGASENVCFFDKINSIPQSNQSQLTREKKEFTQRPLPKNVESQEIKVEFHPSTKNLDESIIAEKLPQGSTLAAPDTVMQAPIVSALQITMQELTNAEEECADLSRELKQNQKIVSQSLQLLNDQINTLDKKLKNFEKNLIPKCFSLTDLNGICTPELRRSLTELIKLKAELEKLGATVYLHGSFAAKCCTYILTRKTLKAKDLDIVVELPPELSIDSLLEKIHLTTRDFSFNTVPTDFKHNPSKKIPQSRNFISNDKNSVKIDIVVREAGYIPNFDPFDLTNLRIDFTLSEDKSDQEEIYFFPDESKLIELSEDILNGIFPAKLYNPSHINNIRNFIPRLAKYLVRHESIMDVTGYLHTQTGQKIYLSPADFLREMINYFRNALEIKMSESYQHAFFGMEKIIKEGHFTHAAVKNLIMSFCAGLLAVEQKLTPHAHRNGTIMRKDVSADIYIRANKMSTILQSYFQEHPHDVNHFKLITRILLSEEAANVWHSLNNNKITAGVTLLKELVNQELLATPNHSFLPASEKNINLIQGNDIPDVNSPMTTIKLQDEKSAYLPSNNLYSNFYAKNTQKKPAEPFASPSPVNIPLTVSPQSGQK